MHNNYDNEVFKGDLGRVFSIDFTEQMLRVAVDERFINFDWADVTELTHGYAISVHRSQGSEYSVIVLPIMTQHYLLMAHESRLFRFVTQSCSLAGRWRCTTRVRAGF